MVVVEVVGRKGGGEGSEGEGKREREKVWENRTQESVQKLTNWPGQRDRVDSTRTAGYVLVRLEWKSAQGKVCGSCVWNEISFSPKYRFRGPERRPSLFEEDSFLSQCVKREPGALQRKLEFFVSSIRWVVCVGKEVSAGGGGGGPRPSSRNLIEGTFFDENGSPPKERKREMAPRRQFLHASFLNILIIQLGF